MNNTVLIVAIIIILVVAGYFVFRGNYGTPAPANNGNNGGNNNPPPGNNNQTSTNTTTPPASTADVNIQNFAFNPAVLTVKAGTTVTWTNNDSATHQIKSDTFNSAGLSRGQKFSHQFNSAGTFNYSCAIHPSMTGQIIVQ